MNQLREAVILVGGLGTRLRSVVADRPKVLAEVNGKPFLAYLLEQVAAAGITHTVLCTGYRGEQVQTAFGEQYAGMQLSFSQETTLLGTGGALRLALPQLSTSTFLALNGDSFCEVNLADFWAWHLAHQARASLILSHQADTSRYGRVSSSANGAIQSFDEKDNVSGPGWINAGLYLLSSELLEALPPNEVISLERQVFPKWIGQGLFGFPNQGRFVDIGTPESYAQAAALVTGNFR